MTKKLKIFLTIIFCTSLSVSSQYDSIFHDGNFRTFLLHLPADYYVNDTLPMVICMHGGFGSAYNIEDQSKMSIKADAENFIVVYPEGLKGGLLQARSWNAGWCCGNSSATNVDDVGFIDNLIDTLLNKYAINTKRIYATGMSNGGFMSYRLACELSGRIAAIAPVSASMSMTGCNPERPIPVLHVHSYQDTSVPYDGGFGDGISSHYNAPADSVHNVWAKNNHCKILNDTIINNGEYTFVKWDSCDCGAIINYYITRDGGHSWAGGNQTPVGDPTSDYISATDSIWAFFMEHTLDCIVPTTTDLVKNDFIKNNDFEIFPNPSSGMVYLKPNMNNEKFTVSVYNYAGEKIFKAVNIQSLNITNQPCGVYFISVQSGCRLWTKKLVKPD